MYGCQQAYPAEKTADPAAMAASQNMVWENEQTTCPICRETISKSARRCPFCTTPLQFHNGRMISSYQGALPEDKLRYFAITIFVLSFIPCIAPLVFLTASIWGYQMRGKLAKVGQIYPIITYLAIGISGIFTLVILLFMLSGALG
jgi:hypothetical protein